MASFSKTTEMKRDKRRNRMARRRARKARRRIRVLKAEGHIM